MSDPLAQAYPAPGAFASPPPMPSPSSYPMPVHAGHFAPPHPSGMAPGVAAVGVPSLHQMPPMPPTAQGGYYYVPPTPPAPQAMQPPAAMHHMVPPGGGYFYLQPPVPGQQASPPGQPAVFSSPPSMLPIAQPTPHMAYGHTPQQPQHDAPHHHKGAGNTFTPNMMSVDRGVHEKATQLRIHRLGRDATPSEFAELFDPFGLVNLVRIVKHKDTQAPRGYGFVYFHDHEAALAAVEAAQRTPFLLNGQALEVGFADPQRPLSRRALAHVAFRMRKKQQLEDEAAAAAEGTPRSGSVTGSDGMPRMITDATEFRTTSPASAESATATPALNSDGEDELSRRLRDSVLGASTGLKE